MFKRRLLILQLVFLVLGGVSFARLYQIQIVSNKSLLNKAANPQNNSQVKLRGNIYDRNGQELALSLPVTSAYINPASFIQHNKLDTVAKTLGMQLSQVKQLAASDKSFVWLKRKISPRQRNGIRDLKLEGVGLVAEKKRFYPKKALAAHLLGIVGIDGKGLEGLEYQFDHYLQGNGNSPKRHDLVLTIDENIQYIAQKELGAACEDVQAKAGSVIVMEPYTGEILAMANYPYFNPNSFTNYQLDKRRNRAITDIYEPGSTMKAFAAAAALEEDVFSPDSLIWCEQGAIELGDLTIKDTAEYGNLTFSQVLKHSSNVGAIKIGLALGKSRLYSYLRDFGFGASTEVDFPGETKGILRTPQEWSKVSSGIIAIGQEIAVTPLQLVTAMSAIANGGNLVKPCLVRAVKDTNSNKVIKTFEPSIVRRVISPETAKKMTKILSGVVKGGTGKEAALPNVKVAGKTGTAQKVNPLSGSYFEDKVVASFVGYLPAEKSQVVILVMIDEPKRLAWGGKVAAPLFRRIATQLLPYMGIAPKADSLRVAVNN